MKYTDCLFILRMKELRTETKAPPLGRYNQDEAHLQGTVEPKISISLTDSLTRFYFQDLKQQKFVIEAEPSETVRKYISAAEQRWRVVIHKILEADLGHLQVGQVKEKISNEKGWEAGQQKLIYSGMCARYRRHRWY